MEHIVHWWNHLPQHLSPVLWSFGPFQLRYYSLMYLTAILVFYLVTLRRVRGSGSPIRPEVFDAYMSYAILGVILGARLGYVAFYDQGYFWTYPLQIFWPYQVIDGQTYFGISGLSYHGGVLGVLVATASFCKKYKIHFWTLVDFLIPAVPLGYMFGRFGNFLNGELYGRVTDLPWGMYFPSALTHELRHPSQLYEAFFEGLILFFLIWVLRKKSFFPGFLFALYIIGYGLVRFGIEYVREPDDHLGLVFWNLSTGQILCFGMVVVGGLVMLKARAERTLENKDANVHR